MWGKKYFIFHGLYYSNGISLFALSEKVKNSLQWLDTYCWPCNIPNFKDVSFPNLTFTPSSPNLKLCSVSQNCLGVGTYCLQMCTRVFYCDSYFIGVHTSHNYRCVLKCIKCIHYKKNKIEKKLLVHVKKKVWKLFIPRVPTCKKKTKKLTLIFYSTLFKESLLFLLKSK